VVSQGDERRFLQELLEYENEFLEHEELDRKHQALARAKLESAYARTPSDSIRMMAQGQVSVFHYQYKDKLRATSVSE